MGCSLFRTQWIYISYWFTNRGGCLWPCPQVNTTTQHNVAPLIRADRGLVTHVCLATQRRFRLYSLSLFGVLLLLEILVAYGQFDPKERTMASFQLHDAIKQHTPFSFEYKGRKWTHRLSLWWKYMWKFMCILHICINVSIISFHTLQ